LRVMLAIGKDKGGLIMLRKMLMLIIGLIFLFIPPLAVAQMPMPEMVPAPSSSMILGFDTMAPVQGPFVGDAYPIRGVPGGGRPWMIEEAQGELDSDGMLAIKVQGLVLVDTGMNPAAGFKGIVSCLTPDDMGGVTYVNLETASYPATEDGNAEIVAKVMLPNVCVAPIVFVASGDSGNWFAVTGHMKMEAVEPAEEEIDEPEEVEAVEPEEIELDVPDELAMEEAVGGSSSDERDDRRDDRKIVRFNDFDNIFDNDLDEFLFFDDDEFFNEEEFEFDSDSSSSTLESDSSSSLRRAFLPRERFFDRDPRFFDRDPRFFPFQRRIIFDRDPFFNFFGFGDDDFLFEERDD